MCREAHDAMHHTMSKLTGRAIMQFSGKNQLHAAYTKPDNFCCEDALHH